VNIVVCIKQVPGTTEIKIDPNTNTLVREGVKSIVNPLDTYAVEEAVRLKERYGGKVTVITMGPPQAQEALKETIVVGADEAFLIGDRAFAGSDTLATAYVLARAVSKIGQVDLVLSGKQTMDGDTGQVGPGMAERLGIPFIGYVSKVEEIKDGKIRLQRLVEDGHEVIESTLPAVISISKEANVPRLPSLRGMMKIKTIQIPTWNAADIGADPQKVGAAGSPTKVIRIFFPKRTRTAETFEGKPDSQAGQLVERLKEHKLV
jgi:electron transfer flavoprotein beta subunit